MKEYAIESIRDSIKYWWVSLAVGILALAVGILSSFAPLITLSLLTVLFTANFLVSGIFEIASAISNRDRLSNWGWGLAGGFVNLIFACILLMMPIGSMVIFIFYVSFYILLQALFGIWASNTLRNIGAKKWRLFMAVAIFGVVLSLILIIKPSFAASFITVIFALALMTYGFFRIFYAFRLKKLKDMFDK